jgi:hypothetical protein
MIATILYNIIFIAILVFAVLVLIYGMFSSKGILSVIKGEAALGDNAKVLVYAIGAGALLIWACISLLQGPQESVLITRIGAWADEVLKQKLNPFQP